MGNLKKKMENEINFAELCRNMSWKKLEKELKKAALNGNTSEMLKMEVLLLLSCIFVVNDESYLFTQIGTRNSLFWATLRDHLPAVKLLLEHGADVNGISSVRKTVFGLMMMLFLAS